MTIHRQVMTIYRRRCVAAAVLSLATGAGVASFAGACSARATPTPVPRTFCDVGYLIQPGQVVDSALALRDSKTGEILTYIVLRARDSVCMLHNPFTPADGTSAKPELPQRYWKS